MAQHEIALLAVNYCSYAFRCYGRHRNQAVGASGNPTMQATLTVTIEQACKITGLGQTTIFGAIKNKELKKAKIGRRTVIFYDELKSWLESKVAA